MGGIGQNLQLQSDGSEMLCAIRAPHKIYAYQIEWWDKMSVPDIKNQGLNTWIIIYYELVEMMHPLPEQVIWIVLYYYNPCNGSANIWNMQIFTVYARWAHLVVDISIGLFHYFAYFLIMDL